MKVLFIGGTGVISSACSALVVEEGIQLYLLNRGRSVRPAPAGARILQGDIRDRDSACQALGDLSFDVVVDWIAYTPEQVQTDLDLFRGRTGQYVFISSASVYQTPPALLPVVESTIADNPAWEYSRQKIACEELLARAYHTEKFPFTIVRPSHTYDRTSIPFEGGYTVIDRMLKGKPVIVHGDGSSLWTLTHHTDFARGFVGLLGNSHAIGETFHITSNDWLTWDQIYTILGQAFGTAPKIIHMPSDLIAAYDAEWGASLLGDKAHSFILDNSKIKRLVPGFACYVPFTQGAQQIAAWYNEEQARRVVSEDFNRLCDRMIERYQAAWPETTSRF